MKDHQQFSVRRKQTIHFHLYTAPFTWTTPWRSWPFFLTAPFNYVTKHRNNLRCWCWWSSSHQSSINSCKDFWHSCLKYISLKSEDDIRNNTLVTIGLLWIQIYCRVRQKNQLIWKLVSCSVDWHSVISAVYGIKVEERKSNRYFVWNSFTRSLIVIKYLLNVRLW